MLKMQICFISVRQLCRIGTQWYAIGDIFEKTNESIIQLDEGMNTLRLQRIGKWIKIVKKMSRSKRMIATKVENVMQVCVHTPIKYSATDVIVLVPNEIEHH